MRRVFLRIIKVTFTVFCVLLLSLGSIGQEPDSLPLHFYFSRKDVPITAGTIQSLNDDKILVLDGNDNKIIIPISDLAKGSKNFVRHIKSIQANFNDSQKSATKLVAKLKTKSTKLKIKYLEEISKLSSAASQCGKEILLVAQTDDDENVRLAGIICFLRTCQATPKMLAVAIHTIVNDRQISSLISLEPHTFFESLVRFGDVSNEIIVSAAYTGTVQFKPDASSLPKTPKTFATTTGKQNTVRALAAHSLSKISTTDSRNKTQEVLKAAEKRINGKIDYATLREIFAGWGTPGTQPPNNRVLQFAAWAAKYEGIFPKEIKAWGSVSQEHARQSAEQQKLVKISKMKNFHDRNNNFITRGTVLNADQGKIVISNYFDQIVSYDFSKFSNADQKWIEAKLKN